MIPVSSPVKLPPHRWATDGRRLVTAEFQREQLARVERQELTLAELARDLSIAPAVVRRWHRLSTAGSPAAVGANDDVGPASELRLALGACGRC